MNNYNVHFVLHGRLGRSHVPTEIERHFAEVKHVVHTTTHRGDAIERARLCCEAGATHIIAVGGDGTLNETVNGVLTADHSAGTPIVSVLPRGSGNDVARMFSISPSVADAAKRIQHGTVRTLDVFDIHCRDARGIDIQRYCLNVADVGLGGMVTQIADRQPRWLPADLKYVLSVVKGLRRYKNTTLLYQSEGDTWTGPAMSICMANCIYFGSGMGIAPDAVPDDGVAEITIIGDVGLVDYFKQMPSLRMAKRLNHPEIEYRRTASCTIRSERPCPIELDGEYIGQTPLTMRVLPRTLPFLV